MTAENRILVIDNYDSFTFNLVHYLMELGAEVEVVRNDALTAAQAIATDASGFLISPGPCTPNEAGISLDLVGACADAGKPLLGVCLGHQAIGLAYGGRVEVAREVMHGRTSTVRHDGTGLFQGLGHTLEATRYHSLLVAEPLPAELMTTAVATDHGYLMGLRHRTLPVEGVQFHPESVMTTGGLTMMRNFLELRGAPVR
jgi:anthranilate synthase component 2